MKFTLSWLKHFLDTNHSADEISHKLMNEENYNIVFVRNPRNGRISIRSNLEYLDTGDILKQHGWGGGHAASSGMWSSDNTDFKNKLVTYGSSASLIKEFVSRNHNIHTILTNKTERSSKTVNHKMVMFLLRGRF
jgi:hypothetical protein